MHCLPNPRTRFKVPLSGVAESRPLFLKYLRKRRGDDRHGVDLLGIAAAGEVVDRRVQAEQDRAVGIKRAEALGDLVADVAGVDVGEDKGIGVAADRRR